jgi:phenylalanyl-tRNA synthetase alpha chain
VRVAALGKKGSVAELLKTLGAMSPDERKINGPLFNGLRDRVTASIATRRNRSKIRRWMRGCSPSAWT